MEQLRYARTKETVAIDDDTVQITSTSYTTKLSSVRVETSQDVKTSQQTVLKDLVGCLDELRDTDDCLVIKITKKHGQPSVLTKTWTVSKEYYGK